VEQIVFVVRTTAPSGTAALLLIEVAVAPEWVLSLKAARIDPMVALRHE
jgi:hypothetical protein